MRVRVNFTVSCNVVTDVLISDNVNQTDDVQIRENVENEILRILHDNRESVIDKGGCLIVDTHEYQIVK